jgi:hypothetical protein
MEEPRMKACFHNEINSICNTRLFWIIWKIHKLKILFFPCYQNMSSGHRLWGVWWNNFLYMAISNKIGVFFFFWIKLKPLIKFGGKA